MCLLILGGTQDAKKLAQYFSAAGLDVIYSVAGIVRMPKLDCQVVSGGFAQFKAQAAKAYSAGHTEIDSGLSWFIRQHHVQAVLDATHPFAQSMSEQAADVTKRLHLPYWRFARRSWQPEAGDHWRSFDNWSALAENLCDFKAVLLTVGQLSNEQWTALKGFDEQKQWIRTAVAPECDIPTSAQWIQDIGPFALAQERALMRAYDIDVLVTKNSGGEATSAKLRAARELDLPVFLLQPPTLPAAQQIFYSHQTCQQFVLRTLSYAK